jgi:imidazolonepropionase-like amidohydrolase
MPSTARTAFAFFATLLATTQVSAQTPNPLRAGDVVLRGGWLFDARGDEARRNTGIVIRNGTLLEVDARLDGRDLSAARVIELGDDEHVLPGLFDLHAHYAVDLFGAGRVDEWTVNAIVFLANGVTSTFPAGEMQPDSMRAARLRIDAGEQPGPRIHNSGPYFGSARPGWEHAAISADSVRREVDYWAARGARGFKAKGIQPLHLDALIGQAHRHGLTVTGHLDSGFRSSVNPRDAILMGIDRVEHFLGGDAIVGERPAYTSLEQLDVSAPAVRDIIALYLAHRVNFDATLTAYGYFGEREPAVYERWYDEMGLLTPYARAAVDAELPRRTNAQFERIYHVKRKTVKAFYDAGGGDLLTLGTDHPSWGEFFSGFGAHRELHAFVLAGIPPAAALRIGTINGARALGVDALLGSIEPGKLADVFVVRGDPLADIRNTRNVRLVIRAGVVYDAAELLAGVAGRMGPAGEADAAWWKGELRAPAR